MKWHDMSGTEKVRHRKALYSKNVRYDKVKHDNEQHLRNKHIHSTDA